VKQNAQRWRRRATVVLLGVEATVGKSPSPRKTRERQKAPGDIGFRWKERRLLEKL